MKIVRQVFLLLLFSINSWAVSNQQPVADAGDDLFKLLGETIVLEDNSQDPEGEALEYHWALIARPTGSEAILSDSIKENPSFIADLEGTYIARLRVSDGIMVSDHDDVIIRVVANSRPIAIVGADQSLQPGTVANLDASASFDLEQSELSYQWSIDIAPAGSNAYIFSPNRAETSFIPDIPGLYLIRVFVSDSALVDSAYIRFRAAGEIARPPTADAGDDRVVATGESLMLNGEDSSDLGGLELSYSWELEIAPTGSQAVLINPASGTPSFTPDLDGEYYFSLQVSNGTLTSAPDMVRVVAQQRPSAQISSRSFAVGASSTLVLNALESLSPLGEDLSYQWTIDEKPEGSQAALSNASSVISILNTDRVGTYVISLVASSEHLDSIVTKKRIIVSEDKEETAIVGSTVIVDGSHFSSASVTWELISRPEGSRSRLLEEESSMAKFFVDMEGSYIVRWHFDEGDGEYFDYSLVHAYPAQGAVAFGPQSLEGTGGDDEVLCRFFLGL